MIEVEVALYRRDFSRGRVLSNSKFASLLPTSKLFFIMPRVTPDIVDSRNVLGGTKDRVFKTNTMRTISRIDHREGHQQPIQPYPSNQQVG